MTGLNFAAVDVDADPFSEDTSDDAAVIEVWRALFSGVGQIRRDFVYIHCADADTKALKALILNRTRDPTICRIAVICGIAQLCDGLAHSRRWRRNDDTGIECGV